MFSSKVKAERTAAQAWDYLLSAMAAAGVSAREAGKYTADVASDQASRLADAASGTAAKVADAASGQAAKAGKKGKKMAAKANKQTAELSAKGNRKVSKASGKVSGKADEAWARANAAAAVLAGRKSAGRPWGLIIGVGLLGVAVGWAAASTARAALDRQAESEELELAETAVVVNPTYDD